MAFLPRLTLRSKLALLSTLLFVIPLIGFHYAAGIKGALLEAQEQILSLTARSAAEILKNRPELFARNIPAGRRADNQLHAYTLARPIILDGNSDDWGNLEEESVLYSGDNVLAGYDEYLPESLNFRAITGNYGNYIYALFQVTDEAVVYRDRNSLHIDRSDHFRIAVQGADGKLQLYLMSPSEPGRISAFLMPGNNATFVPIRPESRIHGWWRETTSGYVAEFRIHKDILTSSRLSLAVGDVDDTRTKNIKTIIGTGSTSDAENLGLLILSTPELENLLKILERPATRVWLVDRARKVKAVVGTLATDDTKQPAKGNGFIARIWSAFLHFFTPAGSSRSANDIPYPESFNQDDAEKALIGQSLTTRHSLPGTDIEIIAASEPLLEDDRIVGAVIVEQATDTILALKNSIIEKTLLLTVLAFTAAAVLFFLFATRLSNRIRRLSIETDKSFGSEACIRTEFSYTDANDEIGDLARNLSTMMQRLKEFHGYQEKMADNLEHELRTPLAAISATLTNLQHDLEPQHGKSTEYLEEARYNLKRMEKILAKIREAAGLEEALKLDETVKFDLREALKSWTTGYRKTFADRNFELNLPAAPTLVNADPDRIFQLLDKLVENGVDFSPPGSTIRLSLGRQTDRAAITVTNEGPELAGDQISRVFNPMFSGRRNSGTGLHLGLGLFIVRTIAEFHGGTVSVGNRGDGISGVSFTIYLPLFDWAGEISITKIS